MCFLRISLFIPGRSHGDEEVGPRGTGALHTVLWTSGRLPKCLEPQEPLMPGTERQELLSAAILLHAELWSCFGLIIPCYVPIPPCEVEYSLCAIVYWKLITFFKLNRRNFGLLYFWAKDGTSWPESDLSGCHFVKGRACNGRH